MPFAPSSVLGTWKTHERTKTQSSSETLGQQKLDEDVVLNVTDQLNCPQFPKGSL